MTYVADGMALPAHRKKQIFVGVGPESPDFFTRPEPTGFDDLMPSHVELQGDLGEQSSVARGQLWGYDADYKSSSMPRYGKPRYFQLQGIAVEDYTTTARHQRSVLDRRRKYAAQERRRIAAMSEGRLPLRNTTRSSGFAPMGTGIPYVGTLWSAWLSEWRQHVEGVERDRMRRIREERHREAEQLLPDEKSVLAEGHGMGERRSLWGASDAESAALPNSGRGPREGSPGPPGSSSAPKFMKWGGLESL